MNDFPHYFKALPPGCTHVDVYRVLDLFGVVDPPIQHAVKKLLCAGERGNKTMPQDIAEAIATLHRWQQMREEEQPFKRCDCRAKLVGDCPGQWEPGCDLGANEAHVVPAPPEAADALREAIQPESDLREAVADIREIFENDATAFDISNSPDVWTIQPAPAAAPEDAERAAYLARWKDAPEWGQWLSQDHDGECGWSTEQPSRYEGRWLCTVPDKESFGESLAPPNLLGSFGCEPRPTPAGGQGVEG